MLKYFHFIVFVLVCFFTKETKSQEIQLLKDTLKSYQITSISVQGNKKTKSYIAKREMSIAIGDTVTPAFLTEQMLRSKQNIFNTALFNTVQLIAVENVWDKGKIDIVIDVKERFYFVTIPLFDLYDRNYKVWRNVYNSDWERIRYGVKLKHNNVTGNRDVLRLNVINGFSKEISLNYFYPYIDKKMRVGLGAYASYLQRIGVSYIDSLNYGLPRKVCNTCVEPNFKLYQSKDKLIGGFLQYRKSLYNKHTVSISFVATNIADTIARLNQNYFTNGNRTFSYLDAAYIFNYNKVDYFAYPTKGITAQLGITQRIATQNLSQTLIQAQVNLYAPISAKWFFQSSVAFAQRFAKRNSFYNLRSTYTGIGNLRGLEQFLLVSKFDFGWRNNLVCQLYNKNIPLKYKVRNHDFVPVKLYMRLFSDVGYLHLPNANYSNMHNQLLNSNGVAFEMVTLYDYVFRFEMSYNKFAQVSIFLR